MSGPSVAAAPGPLECRTLRTSDELAGSADLARLHRVVSWQIPPDAWSGGRCGWMLADSGRDRRVAAYKVKGLGIPPSLTGSALHPARHPYDRWPGQPPDYHFGVDDDLEFARFISEPSPCGGMLLRSAAREHRIAGRLWQANVPAVRPVGVYAYPGLSLDIDRECRPMGVAVTASPVAETARADAVLLPENAREDGAGVAALYARRMRLDPASAYSLEGRIGLLAEAYRRFGGSLRRFSEAGVHRYSGHPSNIVIDEDGAACLIDLDSCLPAGPDPALAFMQAARDGMSGLFNLACFFFRQPTLTWPDEPIIGSEPFSAFLDGWAPDSRGGNAEVGRRIAEYVIAHRERLRYFSDFLYCDHPNGYQLYRYVRHDSDVTFTMLYRIAYDRLAAEGFGPGPPLSSSQLDEALARYAGRPRFDVAKAVGL